MVARILIIDEDDSSRQYLSHILNGNEYEIQSVGNGRQVFRAFSQKPFDIVFTRIIPPDLPRVELINEIKKLYDKTEIVILTDHSTISLILDNLNDHHMIDFLFNPPDNPGFVRYIFAKALERRRIQKNVEEFKGTEESTKTKSPIKSDFFANMRHELRNPLNSILGFSQVLLEKYFGPLNEKQEQYVKDIHESGQDLLTLIDDILDLTSLDTESDRLELAHVNIFDIIENSLNFIRQKAFKHGIEIKLSLSDEPEKLMLNLDKRKMKQILFNLLSNALKLTSDGGYVEIEVEKSTISNGESVIISIFSDTPDSDTARRKAISNEISGNEFKSWDIDFQDTNPKLSLTKKLVEKHGGSLALYRQTKGKGYLFTLTLPAETHISKLI